MLVTVAEAVLAVLSGSAGQDAALATVVGRTGSAPQALGAKLLLFRDGRMIGTVGGGAIEAQVLDACHEALRDGQCRTLQAHLVRDLAMCCGGSMEVFVEYLQPQARLVLIGGGHVAQALAPIAITVGFRVHVIEDREELLEHPAFQAAQRLAYDVDELDGALDDVCEHDFVVITTRDHARDELALAWFLERPHRYLGMIGSKRKVHAILGRIVNKQQQLGRPLPDLRRIHAPIGLALGGRTPAEIAISVVAELIAERHGGSGSSMNIVEKIMQTLAATGASPQPE